jgi:hypothetical protein
MTFPSTAIPTTYLDSSGDDPSLARADLLTAVQYINTIIAEKNTANGVLVIQGDGTINATFFPATLAPTGIMTLNPSTNIVKIQNILRLQTIPKSTLTTITDGLAGDLALCTDADTGATPALCIFTGTVWKFLPMASFTTVS